MTDAELIAAMRARAALMDGRAELLRCRAKRAPAKSPARYRDEGNARGIAHRAFQLRQAASSIESLHQVDG